MANEIGGLRVAIEGCVSPPQMNILNSTYADRTEPSQGHGALNPIYDAVKEACARRNWPGVDLVIICGDFQAVRNGHDVEVMSVPAKYRALGDFHEYYSGARKAPYLTIFIGGNHEAASHLAELYYGGWVAPNIYYMGAANVLRLGPLRIAGLSGIWKGGDYRKTHHETLPFNGGDKKSFYHVREFDVRKLLQIREQVDVGLSHDWPRHVEKLGDVEELYRRRPMWKQESLDGSLGSVAAEYMMNRLRPAYWFSAHMHWQFTAIKKYPPPKLGAATTRTTDEAAEAPVPAPIAKEAAVKDANEIDLEMDDEEAEPAAGSTNGNAEFDSAAKSTEEPSITVSDDLRAQLPAAFNKPKPTGPKGIPGQPVPETILNTQTRFLALSKCEPGRQFLQLCDLQPVDAQHLVEYPPSSEPSVTDNDIHETTVPRSTLQYDPEWLAITRAFHPLLTIGDRTANPPPDEGEAAYQPLIAKERAWVEENIVAQNKLAVPHNFVQTAPALIPEADPKLRDLHSNIQPQEYTNPQTTTFCELLGLSNLWDASEEERAERRARGPPPDNPRFDRGGRGGGGGGYRGGRGGGRGWDSERGGGRGRGGRGHGRRGRGMY